MHSLMDIAGMLNRSTGCLSELQTRFELPVFEGAGYSDAYLEFLRTIVFLRTFGVSEESLRELWSRDRLTAHPHKAEGTGPRVSSPCVTRA